MGKKGKITLYMDLEVVKKAKELGLNISKVSENALKGMIRRIEGSNSTNSDDKGGIGTVGSDFGSPGEIRTPVSGSRARHA